jgi:mannose-6-phosphate isomerase
MRTDPHRIEPMFVERVWGRTDLSPLYGVSENKIGEVWFPAGDNFPILVKFLFTSEHLSVQVHPDDAYAREHEGSRGKTEMWYILAAGKDARIALGFRSDVSKAQLRAAISDGSIEELLHWVPVEAGNTFFTQAGVVHAIGAGVTLCEIQQNSDVTYRIYDYGRPRQLHVDRALDVCSREPYDGRRELPVACEHFVTEMIDVDSENLSTLDCDYLIVVVEGCGTIDGTPFRAGEVWYVPSEASTVRISAAPRCRLLRTHCAGAPI